MENAPRRRQMPRLSKEYMMSLKKLYYKYIVQDKIDKNLGYFSICCLSFHSKGSNSVHGHSNCIPIAHLILKETIDNYLGLGIALTRLANEQGYNGANNEGWTTVPEVLENAYHRVDLYSCVSTKEKSATEIMNEMNETINRLLIENKRLKEELKPK